MSFPFKKTQRKLEKALEEKQGSAIAIYVKEKEKEYVSYLGHSCHKGLGSYNAIGPRSLFDLASLTKILVTLPLFFLAQEKKLLQLQDPVQKYFPLFPQKTTSLAQLLEHRSGLPATEKFFLQRKGERPLSKASILKQICQMKIPPQAPTCYSDLGFLLIGFLLEDIFQEPLHLLFEKKIQKNLSLKHSTFLLEKKNTPMQKNKSLYVATAFCETRKRLLQGEVDDSNCWALGGSAAHAGLFSTLEETASLFTYSIGLAKKQKKKISPQAPFSTAFMLYPGIVSPLDMSWKQSLGHTGFVGTSAWYHPQKERSVILLSNGRVHPERFQDKRWIQTRLHIHSSLWEEMERK